MSYARMRVLPLLLAFACLTTACARKPARSASEHPIDNVILISIDSLRADHVGAYGYPKPTTPFIDSLARSGTVFERAYSTTSWTLPSHVAMLSGLDNRAHQVLDDGTHIPAGVEMLAESLKRHGIYTAGFFSGPYLDPAFGFARGFDEYVNCSSTPGSPTGIETHLHSYFDVTNPALLRELGKWAASGRPKQRNFLFVHMWDVHYNYEPPPEYLRIFEESYDGTMRGEVWDNHRFAPGMDPRDLQHLLALYDGEIRYTDDTIRKIFDALRANGLLEKTAVIVTADHGDEFLEHGGKGHHSTLYEEVLRVPLILHLTNEPARQPRVGHVTSIVDIHPTVCRLFEVDCSRNGGAAHELLSHYRGKPATTRDDALADLTVEKLAFRQSALVTPRGKVHAWEGFALMNLGQRLLEQVEAPRFEYRPGVERFAVFFPPPALPSEKRGVAVPSAEETADAEAKAVLQQLDRRIQESVERGKALVGSTPRKEAEVDEQTRERLRALGYRE